MNISKRFFREAHHKTYDSFFKVSKAKKRKNILGNFQTVAPKFFFVILFLLIYFQDTMDNEILPVDNADMKPNFENQKVTQEEEVSPENVPKLNEDVLEKLTIQTVDKVMKLFDEIKIKEKAKPNEEKRELLRQKLRYGIFRPSGSDR